MSQSTGKKHPNFVFEERVHGEGILITQVSLMDN